MLTCSSKANKTDHLTKAGPCARVIVNKCNDLKGGGHYWEEALSAFCLFFVQQI